MKRILLTVVAGLLLAGISLAQDNSAPASGSEPQQTPSATPSQPQMPEPSTAQPSSPQQAPEQAPPTQPSAQPPAASQPAPTPNAGQTGTAASHTNAPKIAPGSVIPAQLTKGVDAKKAKTGDEVVAKVTQDMKTGSGEVLVPKDTKLVGHVTEAQARSKEQKESQVGIAFDRAVMKNGTEMQLPMSIQAVIGQQQNNANAGGGNEQAGPGYSQPSGNTGGGMAGGGNRNPGMSGSNQAPPSPSATAGAGNEPSESQAGAAGRPPITGQTQGVVGISNLKLEAGSNPAQGSVLSSEKNNVKLDSGTLLLLRVNQPQ